MCSDVQHVNEVNKCVAVVLQDILQAALHVETDLEQCPMSNGTSLVSEAPLRNVNTDIRPKTAQLFGGHDSVAGAKVTDARVECRDHNALVSTADTMNTAVDPAAVFCLSHDDFSDDIDDLSFIDIPQHSAISQPLKSFAVTADSQQASGNRSSSSVVADVSSNDRLQLTNNCDLGRRDVNSAMSDHNENQSFVSNINFPSDSGKYFFEVFTCTYCS